MPLWKGLTDTQSQMEIAWKQPSHPDQIFVSAGPGRTSAAISLVCLPAGAFFAPITGITSCYRRTWTSVQHSVDGSNIELNSDLVFCNHSCRPSLVFDMSKLEVRVADNTPLKAGDPLTFFYPSTEWDMVAPFTCECSAKGASRCGRRIVGAKHADRVFLERFWLNDHIKDLLATYRSDGV